ncbi:unnamed protein product [Ranitomeya imitator]|uniref:Uncharacterized protein n=1 Tax=Ranitomeya imitator TaxID=111125 RepID=A0ABN9LAG6_9NEOB|nr:unnamed protein product [Ranitomeya imitator]
MVMTVQGGSEDSTFSASTPEVTGAKIPECSTHRREDEPIQTSGLTCFESVVALEGTCQHQRIAGGPNPLWRQRVQWQNNGRVYSLLSQGSEYQPSRRRTSTSNSSHSPLLLLSTRNNTSPGASGRPQASRHENPQTEVPQTTGSNQASGTAGRHWFQAGRPRSQGEDASPRQRNRQESATDMRHTPAQPSSPQPSQRVNATANRARLDMMQGDDPYNPYKYNDDNPYYNYYDTYDRPRSSDRQRPGYGTRNHQYGQRSAPKQDRDAKETHHPQEASRRVALHEEGGRRTKKSDTHRARPPHRLG